MPELVLELPLEEDVPPTLPKLELPEDEELELEARAAAAAEDAGEAVGLRFNLVEGGELVLELVLFSGEIGLHLRDQVLL